MQTKKKAFAGWIGLAFIIGVIPAFASLPSGWNSTDVGAVTASGSSSESGGTFTVTGSGKGIGGTRATDTDEFHFCYQTKTGDFEITARVDSAAVNGTSIKTGLMIRESLGTSDRFVSLSSRPDGALKFDFRNGLS